MSKMSSDTRVLHGPTMGTRWSLTAALPPGLEAEDLRARLAEAVARVDRQMTTWDSDSDLMRLNRAAPGHWIAVPHELMTVLEAGLDIGRQSGGLFDIGTGAALRAWGFGPAAGRLDPGAIRAAAASCPDTAGRLELDPDGGRVRLHGPVDLDLSGIAKGFGVDELARTARAAGLSDFLAAIDGELVAAGRAPGGRPWAVALEAPDPDRRAARGVLELSDQAVATSGNYRHFHRIGGQRIAHTINPRTGAPVLNRVASVTVLADRCMEADAWATVLMCLGETAGPALARARGIEAIFLIEEEGALREEVTLG